MLKRILFVFVLTILQVKASDEVQPELKGRRVLLIGGDLFVQNVTAHRLRSWGVSDVDQAYYFSSAKQIIAEREFDLVIADLDVGRISELNDELRRRRPWAPFLLRSRTVDAELFSDYQNKVTGIIHSFLSSEELKHAILHYITSSDRASCSDAFWNRIVRRAFDSTHY